MEQFVLGKKITNNENYSKVGDLLLLTITVASIRDALVTVYNIE